jgi:hypothetical protein
MKALVGKVISIRKEACLGHEMGRIGKASEQHKTVSLPLAIDEEMSMRYGVEIYH